MLKPMVTCYDFYRFDEAWLFLFSISTQGLAANSAQTESIADAASVGLTGQKRKRDNDNIRAAISLLQSEEITVYNNVINVQVKAVHSVEIIRLVNNIVSGRWVHRRENFREGLVISAAAMIALDRSAPTQFLGDNVPSKLLLMCIRDWMEQCTLTTKMPINMHECSKGMKNNLLTGVYDNLCSSVRSDNLDSSMMSHFTKMQMDISLSYDMSCSRLTPSMESMLPPVVNFINRTLMAVQIATELICLSIATGAVDISTKKICSALEVHAGILLPSMLSFILRWSLNTYISRCCVVSDDDRCTCESLLKYAFACIQLSKLVPNVFIRADIVVTALEADENGADIITQLAPLILHGWILSDKYRVKLILEMLSQLCQLLDLFPGSDAHNAESISADAGADNIQQRADYCLLRLLSLFGVGQLRLAPLCVDEVFPLNVEIVKFAENAKSNCRFVQDSRSNTIRLTSDVVILQYADCSSKLKVCNKWLLIDEGIVSLKKICEIEGNTVIAAIGKISLFLGKELAQYSFLLRSSEGGFMILPTIETLLANYMPKYKIEQVLQEEGVTSYRILEDDFCSQSSTKSSSTDAIREEADPFLTFICSSIYLPLIFMNSK